MPNNTDKVGIIRARAHARAGLIGNPSDGYFGKTISFTFDKFYAELVVYPSRHLELLPSRRDRTIYENIEGMVDNIQKFGYYGGIRLLQASIKRFLEYCNAHGFDLHDRNFSMRYFTNIPSHVGLAGSSAIITACFRALMQFYDVEIPNHELANVILSVETEELGIGAGLQDRVAQVYGGLMFMDFNSEHMQANGCGKYERLDPALLANVYVAYKRDMSEVSDVFHNNLRARFDAGEAAVVAAMDAWADLTTRVRDCLLSGDIASIGPLLDANFDLRNSLCRIHPENIAMVEVARAVGASAKFTGSGGAIVGLYEDPAMYGDLETAFGKLGIDVLQPKIV